MSSAPSETDYIVSISFQTKPEEDRQTQITAEVSQYLTSRKVQFVALDRGLCQDQSLDAIPCGPAASGVQAIRSQPQLKSKLGQNSVFQNSNSGMDTAQEKSGDNQDSHSAPSSLSESWDNLMLNPFFRRLPS